jgi:hypothetical protein
MTINQCNWAALQHVPCPAANASTSELHIMLQNVSGTLERSNQIQSFPAFLSDHLLVSESGRTRKNSRI